MPWDRRAMMLPWQQKRTLLPWQRRRTSGNETWTMLAGMALGGAMVYFLDPEMGDRRRQMAAERARTMMHQAIGTAKKMGTDISDKREAMMHGRYGEILDSIEHRTREAAENSGLPNVPHVAS
jgi:hypothetical protein